MPLIKCLGPNETQEVLADIHEGICGQQLGAKALAKKVLRAEYYWPTMLKDAREPLRQMSVTRGHAPNTPR
jgi:hypothetical protein